MQTFQVTYEIIDHDSEAHGGVHSEDLTLREALQTVFETRTSHCGGVEAIEASCSDRGEACWVTVYNGMEYLTGFSENRSLHFPDNLSASSKRRIIDFMNTH